MQSFIAYPTTLNLQAVTALIDVARGTSALTLNEKVNAAQAVQMYATGQVLPVTQSAPTEKLSAAKLTNDELAGQLESLKAGSNKAASPNWPGILAAVIALIQALTGA